MTSEAVGDYLKTIYKLQSTGSASTSDIAASLSVAPASATSMIKRLARLGFVRHRSYRGVNLTKSGMRAALELIRHHRLLELYLREVMGYTLAEVHAEACRLEHHISEIFEDRIARILGDPAFDPHGDPIPTKDGRIAEADEIPLSAVKVGEAVSIHRISDTDPELLGYLEETGLLPKARVTVLRQAPLKGPVTLRAGDRELIVGREVTDNVFVLKKSRVSKY